MPINFMYSRAHESDASLDMISCAVLCDGFWQDKLPSLQLLGKTTCCTIAASVIADSVDFSRSSWMEEEC